MRITAQIKLKPTKEQKALINATMREYVHLANECLADMVTFNEFGKLTSKNVDAELPSALKNQSIADAKSAFHRYRKTGVEPIFRKPVAVWNNQNYRMEKSVLVFSVLLNGKSQRIHVKAIFPEKTYDFLESSNKGTLRITEKGGKLIAQIAVETNAQVPVTAAGVMGVDLGLKCPAVCYTDTGKVKFIGNGRKNKYIRRRFKTRRKKMGKAKKPEAIKKLSNKEQRIIKDADHKVSREIINFAVKNGIGTIKLEKLANIRRTTRTSRKNEFNLHTWSFYRLASFVEYKAKLLGIKVEYVEPAYTSQVCPVCGKLNHANDRSYQCDCGYHAHRDLVGAINICAA